MFRNLLAILTSGVIGFSCGKEINENKIAEIKSVSFLAEKNKVTVEGKQDVNDLFKSLFIIKTPQREISAYTKEQTTLNSKITIDQGGNVYVKMPYNTLLNLTTAGTLTATIISKSAPGTSPTTLDIPISIAANEFTHQKMTEGGVVKKLPKKIGDKDIEKEYSITFKYDKDAATSASANCDLFTGKNANDPITTLSFTRNYRYKSMTGEYAIVNNSYVCENASEGYGKCASLSKTSKAVTPVLTTALNSKNGSSAQNAIEMHFEGGTLTSDKSYAKSSDGATTTISNPDKSFDIGVVHADFSSGEASQKVSEKIQHKKFTLPNFAFIADGAVLPDGAFFSIEGLTGTDTTTEKTTPLHPNRGFKIDNTIPGKNKGIIFKVVAQNGTSQKFYKLIFKNKFTSSTTW
ncbi:hypothetical protein [Ichthyobacterium seriolicida]|nr:hypothetical protein [Ichthyobacterium seriolicida]